MSHLGLQDALAALIVLGAVAYLVRRRLRARRASACPGCEGCPPVSAAPPPEAPRLLTIDPPGAASGAVGKPARR